MKTVRQWLEEPRKPEDGPLKSSEIFTLRRLLVYEGGKSAVYDLVRAFVPSKQNHQWYVFELPESSVSMTLVTTSPPFLTVLRKLCISLLPPQVFPHD